MLDKVRNTITEYDMLSHGDSVCVGLSGGADSVSLLVALNLLKVSYDLELSAVHVNHQLRGDESLRDEKFCIEVCERLGVPLTVKRIDVTGYCTEHKLSTEEGARVLRYQIFNEVSADKIATAHTLSDDCETIIYNLTRGSALKGLIGIPAVRGNVIRPLIECTRADVEDFLKVQGFGFVTDSTNLSDDYTRNKIRHNVIPILKELNPQFEKKVLGTVRILYQEEQYLERSVDEVYKLSDDGKTIINDIRGFDSVIRRRCISRFLKENSLEYNTDRILSIDDILMHDGKINVTTDVYLVAKLGILSIIETPTDNRQNLDVTPVKLNIGGETKLFDKIIHTRLDKSIEFINKKLTYYYLDYDKIQGEALARGRNFGDKIRLINRGFTSSVKKLLNEKVPKECRHNVCFIADDVGLIFMEHFGVADRVACDSHTKNYLIVEITKEE